MNKGPLMPPNASRGINKATTETHAGVVAGSSLESLSFSSPFDVETAATPATHTAASVKAKFGGDVQIGDTKMSVELAA